MAKTSLPLFHTSQIRAVEQIAVREMGLSESILMERAGKAAFEAIREHFPTAKKFLIYCGSGNNAGDGYVLALLLHQAQKQVVIYQYKAPNELPEAAEEAALEALDAGVPCYAFDELPDYEPCLIVDALLGTGLSGDVRNPILSAINTINSSQLPVLALDIPSGLQADTGTCMGVCVRATMTITFIAYKLGLLTLDGPDAVGKIICDDLKLAAALSTLTPQAEVLDGELLSQLLPKRPRNCHKGDFGQVLVIGGSPGMPGSVCLAAEAALRVGAGMVTIATHPLYAKGPVPHLPEAMIYGIERSSDIAPLLSKASVCLIGPGLGEQEWGMQLFKRVIASQMPIIIDAQALRILANIPQQDDNWVLTPHPGEAAALLGTSVDAILEDRYQSVSILQAKYGGQVLLKGVGTLIRTDEAKTYLCAAGNAGMATAGMGDVLSGVIAGLAAQKLLLPDAVKLGVWLHAKAADLACAKEGERGLIARDLMPFLRILANPETP